MTKAIFRKRSIAMLLTTLGAVAAVAAPMTALASPPSRTIEGNFCLGQHLFCMSAGLEGRTAVEGYGVDGNGGKCVKPPGDPNVPSGPQYCVPSGTGRLTLTPGLYWLTVYDDQNNHNFTFRSCPFSRAPCTDSNPRKLFEQQLTDIATVYTQPVTTRVYLLPGTYRLFCDSDTPVVHENAGMYVDITVPFMGWFG